MTAPVAVCGSLSMLVVRDFFDPFRHAIGEAEAIRAVEAIGGVFTHTPGIRCHGGPCADELSQDVDRDRIIGNTALSWERIELNRGNAGRWSHPAPPGDCAGPSASRARTHPMWPALGTTHVPNNGSVSEGLQIVTNSRVNPSPTHQSSGKRQRAPVSPARRRKTLTAST